MASTPRAPLLELADPELEWKRFERFCLDLARAQPDVVDAHLYGTRGEDQQGIDIHVDLVDGRVRTIQCRRVSRFTKDSVTKTIADTTYEADEHQLWCTCAMRAGARDVLRVAPNWTGWDIEQVSSAVRGLPREFARWIVEDHLGSAARRRFLGPEGDLCVAPARWWFERRDADDALLPTNQPLVGRAGDLGELRAAVADPAVRLVLLPGRPGIGKTRLLRAVAEDVADDERVLLLRDGVDVTAGLADELPRVPFTLLIDDADRRSDLPGILATVLAGGDAHTIVFATRPQHVPALRAAIAAGGVASDAVCEVGRLGALSRDEGAALAAQALGSAGALSERLGMSTRDIPALCILGARLAKENRLDPAHLSSQEDAQHEILSRFRDELLGDVSERADRTLIRHVLEAVATLQPFELHAPASREWLGRFLGCTADELEEAARALEDAGLLAGGGRRRRVVPDLLADFIVQEVCTRDGEPTDYAQRILAAAPAAATPPILANLAELDWRLSEVGRPTVLDDHTVALHRAIVEADAWEREQLLKQLSDAAPYLAPWIIALARDLLDHPAPEVDIGFGHLVGDASARLAFVPLLRSAGLDLRATQAAVALLWEIGRDGPPRASLGGVEPLKAAGEFGNYELGLPYAEAVLAVVEQLLLDPSEAEGHRELPLSLLQPMTQREGTRSRSRGYAIELSSFLVSASATKALRTRLRELLVRSCVEGGDRTRPAAAALLGDMLGQPHGYFGRPVPADALAQWRDEQMLILADIDRILDQTDDVLVTIRLRDDVDWHARHSAIRGVRTRARSVFRAHHLTTAELLMRALTQRLGGPGDLDAIERRDRAAARRIAKETPRPTDLLNMIDAALERVSAFDPKVHADPGQLLSRLAADDTTWGLEAASILVDEPHRASARAVGVLLKRDLAVALAADDDPVVASNAVLAALRLADREPELARRIMLAVDSLKDPAIAKDVCMVLTHELGLTDDDENLVLDRLLECPDVDYWQDRFLLRVAERRPGCVVRYFLARIDRKSDDYGYGAVPFDGLSKDPVAGRDDDRRDALRRLMAAAPNHLHSAGGFHLATLFWSFGAGSDEAFETLAEALASDTSDLREAAEEILSQAKPGLILVRPAWVAEQLGRRMPSTSTACVVLSSAL